MHGPIKKKKNIYLKADINTNEILAALNNASFVFFFVWMLIKTEHCCSISKELQRLTKFRYLIFVVKRAWKVQKFMEEWQERCTNWRKDSKEGRTVVLKARVLRGILAARRQIWDCHCCLYKPSYLLDMALCSPVEIKSFRGTWCHHILQ
jgi:hypothetical protein